MVGIRYKDKKDKQNQFIDVFILWVPTGSEVIHKVGLMVHNAVGLTKNLVFVTFLAYNTKDDSCYFSVTVYKCPCVLLLNPAARLL